MQCRNMSKAKGCSGSMLESVFATVRLNKSITAAFLLLDGSDGLLVVKFRFDCVLRFILKKSKFTSLLNRHYNTVLITRIDGTLY